MVPPSHRCENLASIPLLAVGRNKIETILIYLCFTDENVEVQGSEWLAQSHVNISDGAEI